ncbi:hypothetical protein GCM10010468_33490 [Actinocorallia longicatena]|uniref:YdbS-like PH domain-containing protein n=1 Tax=Actinocorallia longicatena TaxID=111803 RepID=A0ABP6Q9W4_9ACTN
MRLVTPGDSAPASINRFLLPQEKQVIVVRKHPAVLLTPVLFVLGGLILAGVLSNTMAGSDAGNVVSWIWWAWLLLLAWFVWQVAEWSVAYFVITNQRMLLTGGLLTRDVAMMPLSKVTDMSYERSPVGRLLGFGKFIAESAGQDQALRTVDHLPYPDQLYAEVCQMIFPGGKPKALEERLRDMIDSIPKMRTELAADVTTGTVHDIANRKLKLEGVQAQLEQLVAESGEWHRQAGELHRQLAEKSAPGEAPEL